MSQRFGVLVASGGATWEGRVVEAIGAAGPGVVLLRRCLDVTELIAAATTGAARVAVVSHLLPGLDADAVSQLARQGTRVLAVAPERELSRLQRLGVARVVEEVEHGFAEALRVVAAVAEPVDDEPELPEMDSAVAGREPGRLVVVWGPHGAPGRTTVAVGLAAQAAHRGISALVLDADPYGGTVAQHLGVTDETSGLLAATRSANAGVLDHVRLAGTARQVQQRLRILTGLPRPDRWREVRLAALQALLGEARSLDPLVVVDAGPGLPADAGHDALPDRDQLVGACVGEADTVVAVVSADPVGLTRGIRALADLADARPGGATYVVVNRWRRRLGWAQDEVRDTVARVCPQATVLFVPDDRDTADRVLGAGCPPTERDGQLGRALRKVADAVLQDVAPVDDRRVRRRRPGRRQTVSSR